LFLLRNKNKKQQATFVLKASEQLFFLRNESWKHLDIVPALHILRATVDIKQHSINNPKYALQAACRPANSTCTCTTPHLTW
jgi:hypothetical protein